MTLININLERIRWCCDDRGITLDGLREQIGIAASTWEKFIDGERGLTFKQLRDIAKYFNRGVLFFIEEGPVIDKAMTLIGIDPGMTCTAIASVNGNRVMSARRIQPPRSLDIHGRCMFIMTELITFMSSRGKDYVIIEIPARQSPDKQRRGQATYGMAAGLAIGAAYHVHQDWTDECEIILAPADEWTRGVAKRERAKRVNAFMVGYDMAKDPGLDVADAIGLCMWWESERLIRRTK